MVLRVAGAPATGVVRAARARPGGRLLYRVRPQLSNDPNDDMWVDATQVSAMPPAMDDPYRVD